MDQCHKTKFCDPKIISQEGRDSEHKTVKKMKKRRDSSRYMTFNMKNTEKKFFLLKSSLAIVQ